MRGFVFIKRKKEVKKMGINLDKYPRTKKFLCENDMTLDEAYKFLKKNEESSRSN
jgi:hypothetical protein